MCLGSRDNDLSWRNFSLFHNKDSEEVGKILGIVSRVILCSSLMYCLLGMEIPMPHFCRGCEEESRQEAFAPESVSLCGAFVGALLYVAV